MSKIKIVKVYDLRDPYFGRLVSSNGEEIAKVFAYYARQDYKNNCDWKTFSYRMWSGYEEDVNVRISRVLLSDTACCYIELESTVDILDHYFPSPYDLIEKRYIGTSSDYSINNDHFKVIYD